MGRFDRELAQHLSPGEHKLAQLIISGSRDIPSDVPEKGLQAVLTNHRVIFFDGVGAARDIYWWFQLDQLASLDTVVEWQRGVLNKGRESMLVFRLRDGQTFEAPVIHVVEPRRRVAKFEQAVRDAAARADRPGM